MKKIVLLITMILILVFIYTFAQKIDICKFSSNKTICENYNKLDNSFKTINNLEHDCRYYGGKGLICGKYKNDGIKRDKFVMPDNY